MNRGGTSNVGKSPEMNGTKRSRKHEAAIAALLREPTLLAAAQAIGVNEQTLRRWLKDPAFAADYKAARRQTLELAVGALHDLAGEAVLTLRQTLTADVPAAVRVRAALGILERAFAGAEMLDLDARVEALEARFAPPEEDR